jgi:type IV secretory pathway VirB2 component (pilin)
LLSPDPQTIPKGDLYMTKRMMCQKLRERIPRVWLLVLMFFGSMPLYAQSGSPWENAVNALQTSFTGPIARGLSLVAIVVGGLAFAFGEGDSKRMLAGIVFGVGMALGAVQLMSWLFG